MGYARAGFEVVGVDIEPQPHYPFPFVQADALEIAKALYEGGGAHWDGQHLCLADFAAIHASPPCQAYVAPNRSRETKWPRLIEPTRDWLNRLGRPFIIENVEGAPLINPIRLCGTWFGLPLIRHRLFEAPTLTMFSTPCYHWGTVAAGDFAAVYAFGGKGHRRGRNEVGERVRDPRSADGPAWADAMGIDWMTLDGLREAIPPAYTEYVGKQLIVGDRSIAKAGGSNA